MATGASHDALDSSFTRLDLTERDDYACFLGTHAIGLVALYDYHANFVRETLGMPAVDYPGMLLDDLAEIDISMEALPKIEILGDHEPAGIAYVLSGSRLGLAMIRKQPYWGATHGRASRFMEDESGIATWKAVSTWLKQQPGNGPLAEAASRAAMAAFDTYEKALRLALAQSAVRA